MLTTNQATKLLVHDMWMVWLHWNGTLWAWSNHGYPAALLLFIFHCQFQVGHGGHEGVQLNHTNIGTTVHQRARISEMSKKM
jgi:hypothetical protein